MLSDMKKNAGDRAKVTDWLSRIGETNPQIIKEVLDACAKDDDCRRYFVKRSQEES